MKQCIIVTYKSGTLVTIDIPEMYYELVRRKHSRYSPHKLFLKAYKKFINEINKNHEVINVSKFFKFSNCVISGVDILSVDICDVESDVKHTTQVYIPDIHNKVFLDMSSTTMNDLSEKLIRLLDSVDRSNLFDKLIDIVSCKETIKPVKKTTTRKKSTKQTEVDTSTSNND